MDAMTPSEINEASRKIMSQIASKRMVLWALKDAPKWLKARGDRAKAAKPRKKRR
jgi:hypothetical protein